MILTNVPWHQSEAAAGVLPDSHKDLNNEWRNDPVSERMLTSLDTI
jgi:hypothetical protein